MQTKIKVLVVEDHQIAQKVALIILNNLNCEVNIAKNGIEALEFVQQKQYDLILMDIGLPDLDGLTLTKNIRNIEDKLCPVPIIGLTAHVGEQIRLQAIEAGMNDLFVKPLLKEKCLIILNKFVVKKID